VVVIAGLEAVRGVLAEHGDFRSMRAVAYYQRATRALLVRGIAH